MHVSARRAIGVLVAIVVVAGFAWSWDRSSQPTSGDGWRLLARQRAIGAPGSATELLDPAELDAAWAKLILRGQPVVDFSTEAVIWIVASGTRACAARLDSVTFDPGTQLVTGAFSLGITAGCDRAVVPDSFLVALDRHRLPAEPFRIRLVGP